MNLSDKKQPFCLNHHLLRRFKTTAPSSHAIPFRAEMKHKLNPVLDAQLNRNRYRSSTATPLAGVGATTVRGHRRNLSDPRFSTSLTDAAFTDEYEVSVRLLPIRLSRLHECWVERCAAAARVLPKRCPARAFLLFFSGWRAQLSSSSSSSSLPLRPPISISFPAGLPRRVRRGFLLLRPPPTPLVNAGLHPQK